MSGPPAAAGSGRAFGRAVVRNEDPRLLTGRAPFVDDIEPPGTLHAAFVRSPHAHARLLGVDLSPALRSSGVVAAFVAADLEGLPERGPHLVHPPASLGRIEFHSRTQPFLARERVRHVGEAVAVVVAESRYLAEDAAEEVAAEYEPLEAAVGLEAALEEGAPRVHADLESNVAARVVQEKGDYDAARREADRVVARRLVYDRGAAAAIENRGVVAAWDAAEERLTVWDTTQAPIPVRNALAGMLGLTEFQVRVVAPFIGGGFGPKIMFYSEEVLVPWLAMRLGRPVKWIEDRWENFFATTQERGQVHEAEIALAADGRILGVRDAFLHDSGAYDPYGLTIPINSQCTLLGPYRVPAYHGEFTVVFTNKPVVTPVRGAGRQHGVFVIERLLDAGARELGIDRLEIRRRNYLAPDDFPHDHGIIFQDGASLVYDSGRYEEALDRAAERIGWRRFVEEEGPRLRGEGRRVGIGLVSYVEGTGIGPYEGARVTVGQSGAVSVATGVGTQGQGHFTVFAQVVAEALGVDVADVRVQTGDTAEFHWGTGTFASRGAVVAGSACHAAAVAVRDKALSLASELLEAAEDDLELAGGMVRVKGAPDHSVSLAELATRANPLRGAVRPGTEPGLEATRYFGPDRGATASGVHAMVVEVDPETGLVDILRYVVVHDCGRLINPTLVEGQIHGGVAMGVGNAFYERLAWDDDGQLVNASFMDYLLPTAAEVPEIETEHLETPSPLNPLGVKGVGEAGAIPTGALFAQAVEDALQGTGIEIAEIPLAPDRVFELLREAGALEGPGAATAGGGPPGRGSGRPGPRGGPEAGGGPGASSAPAGP